MLFVFLKLVALNVLVLACNMPSDIKLIHGLLVGDRGYFLNLGQNGWVQSVLLSHYLIPTAATYFLAVV